MSQDIFTDIDPVTTSGTELATLLNDFRDAVLSGLKGPSRPTLLASGGHWIDDSDEVSDDVVYLKYYTGTVDITMLTLNTTTLQVTLAASGSTFEIRKISDDTTGAHLDLIKARTTGSQVLSGDIVGEVRMIGTTNTPAEIAVCSIKAVSTDNFTSSALGNYLSFEAVVDATSTKVEMMRLQDKMMAVGGQGAPTATVHAYGSTGFLHERAADDATGANVTLKKYRIAGNGSTQSADVTGEIDFQGKDSSANITTDASIKAVAGEAHTSANRGTKLVFDTTNPLTSSKSTKLTIYDTADMAAHLRMMAQAEARFMDSDSSNYVGFKSPATVGTTVMWALPDADAAAAGQVLSSDAAGVLSWKNPSKGPLANKTGNYTTTANDRTITCDATSAGFTITLHTAVGNTGQRIVLNKTDATLFEITVNTTSSQTIAGFASGVLHLVVPNQSVTFESNGTNWVIVDAFNPNYEIIDDLLFASATGLVSGTPKTVVSSSLPRGSWESRGHVAYLSPTGAVTLQRTSQDVFTTTNATSSFPMLTPSNFSFNSGSIGTMWQPAPAKNFVFTTTSSVFLIGGAVWTTNTMSAFGRLYSYYKGMF